ncbi:short-chain dehydrogenase [Bacillus haimaensis]|uniref:short-chain dehydrogenase n=1 Tax=Bacillus haimaensis TaxID=3160967 RepID=UPI003AA9A60E
MRKHALVIGGTGMLSEVSLWLAGEGYHISVVGRDAERMQRLTARSGHISPVLVDYKNEIQFAAGLERAVEENGPIELVVAWIHSDAPQALGQVISIVGNQRGEWSLFHVLGSKADLREVKESVSITAGSSYHQVQLGFVLEGDGSRWLRNDEIAIGVIEAVAGRREVSLVGVLEPWERRP